MHIRYFCCITILSLLSNTAGRSLMKRFPNVQRKSLCILHRSITLCCRNGIMIKIMSRFYFGRTPNSEISKFINAYKSASSRLLKKEFPQIRQKLWKECFWSQSFCLLTTGGAPIEVIRKYIESQGEKSRKRGRSYGKQSI